MELKPGYKKTEVGVIPEEWEVKPLNRISPRQSVGLVINPSSYFDKAGTVPLLVGSNVAENFIDSTTSSRITKSSNELLSASRLVVGDLVTVRVGEPGVTAVVPPELDSCNCASMMIVRRHPSFDSHWLCAVMNSRLGRQQVEHVQYGTAQKQFNISDAVDFCYPVPPLPEQRAIAGALSDVDELLGALEQLIAKKRDLKLAAMHQLLTGQKRLHGFGPTKKSRQTESGSIPEDWEVKPLKTVSSMNGRIGWQGLKQEEFTENPDDPFLITGMNFKDGKIRWEQVYHIPTKRYEEAPAIQLRVDDLLMTKDGTIGKLLHVDAIPYPGKASLNSHLLVFRPIDNQYVPKFLFYQLGSKAFGEYIELNKSGSTFFGLTQEATGNYEAILPPLPEQTAIAEVLSDMDAELSALVQRRDKTRALKQGMMQELLTGRTRLV